MILKKTDNKLLITAFAVLFVLVFSFGSLACTCIIVGKEVTTDGSVITSHTVDGRYESRLFVVPAQHHEEGAMRPVYDGRMFQYAERTPPVLLGYIPQVPYTYQYFQTCYSFANEHQLIIGENTLGGSIETTGNRDEAIMTIRNLARIALERCTTAREAVQLMGDLAVEYGYFGSANRGECLTVIDPNEAWIIEMFGVGPLWTKESGEPGAVWAAVRVPDNHVTVAPNYSRFNFDPSDPNLGYEVYHSGSFKDVAIELGLYDPADDFIWNRVWTGRTDQSAPSDRLWRLYSLIAPSQDWKLEDTLNYPLTIEPEMKLSVADVIALYRDVSQGTFYDMADHDAWYFTDRHGNQVKSPLATPQVRYMTGWVDLLGISPLVRNVAIFSCSSYWVGQARDWLPDPIGGLIWYGLNNPENGPFIPLYVCTTRIPKSYSILNRDEWTPEAAWWAFAQVDFLVNCRYQDMKPKMDAELLNPLQDYWFAMQEGIEARALQLYNDACPDLGYSTLIEFLTEYSYSQMELAEKRYWDYAGVLMQALTGGR